MRQALFAVSTFGLFSCAAAAPKLVPSGFYWLPKEYADGKAVLAKSQECGRLTRDVSVVPHQRAPAGFTNLVFRPAKSSTAAQSDCLIRALGAKPYLLPEPYLRDVRPKEDF